MDILEENEREEFFRLKHELETLKKLKKRSKTMKIEIFVVQIENDTLKRLDKVKETLIKLFGGLTIIPKCHGYWKNQNGNIETDSVEIWQIYTQKVKIATLQSLMVILEIIKSATAQKTLAYTVNNEIHLI